MGLRKNPGRDLYDSEIERMATAYKEAVAKQEELENKEALLAAEARKRGFGEEVVSLGYRALRLIEDNGWVIDSDLAMNLFE